MVESLRYIDHSLFYSSSSFAALDQSFLKQSPVGFAPANIVVLDVPSTEAYVLRQASLHVNLPNGIVTTAASRTAQTTAVENDRANIVNEARTVRIEELKAEAAESLEEDNEDEGEEGAPPMNYDTASLAQLGVDVEALELPPLPTEQELYVF